MTPSTGQYWRLTGEEDPPVEKGDLVLVCGFEDGEILYAFEDVTYGLEPESFQENYVFEPHGDEALRRQVEEAVKEVERQSQQDTKLLSEVAQGGVSDLTVTTPQAADAAKRRIADIRNRTAKIRNKALKAQSMIKRRVDQLKAMAHEQERHLARMADALQVKLKMAEEAIWTVNLYLGRNETVKRLSKGKPASIEEPVVIRQKRLFMDEECALAAETGGITAIEFEQFDEWLLKPENRDRVIPEQRGMVVFRPRREIKPTGNQWYDKAQRERDYKTYFLFRNGENLFRVCTDLEVGGTLFPRRDEGEKLFTKTRFNLNYERVEEVVKPGTEEYMKAMKEAEGDSRHYMRVLLFLQGIFDRTTIFQSLPGGSVNLLDPRDDTLVFLRDAEDVLEDGRPRFSEWLRDLNAKLQPGHRIMGVFRSYGSYSSRGKGSRIWPESCPDHPDDLEIYTLEALEGRPNALKFKFERTNEIQTYDRYSCYAGCRLPKTRASFRVSREDNFILNIDDALIEDIDFYLNSFADRVHYIHLFPLLKKAMEVKRVEAEQEEPFVKLVLGQLAEKYGLAIDTPLQLIAEGLIKWWKLKNKIHRGLKEDDVKALRMILAEHDRRRRLEKERGEREVLEDAFKQLVELHPKALLVGHVREREFVVLDSMNDENVFVKRLMYRYYVRKGRVEVTERREWVTVGKAHRRWMVHCTSSRWEEWRFDVDRNESLTDPEQEELARWALGKLRKGIEVGATRGDRFLPLVVTWDPEKFVLRVWYNRSGTAIDLSQLLTKQFDRLELSCSTLEWSKKNGEIHSRFVSHYGSTYRCPCNPFKGVKVVWQSEQNQAKFQREWERYLVAERKRSLLQSLDSSAEASLKKQAMIEWEGKERVEFDADYGDSELWEVHLESLNRPRISLDKVSRELSLLVERGIEVNGRTVAEIRSAAEPFFSKVVKRRTHGGFSSEEDVLEDCEHLLSKHRVKIEVDDEEADDEDTEPSSVFSVKKEHYPFDDEEDDDE